MAQHTKISVNTTTHALVGAIADVESRTMAGQIEHWAKKDAKRLGIGTKVVTKPDIKIANTKPPTTTNKAGQNAKTNNLGS
ncbi:MAG: hypothetical protein WC426_13435 [Sulfuriferula sp.]